MAAPRVGVLAYQGDVREHLAALAAVGADPVEVRTLADLEAVDHIFHGVIDARVDAEGEPVAGRFNGAQYALQ